MGKWFFKAYQFLQNNKSRSAIIFLMLLSGLVFLVTKIQFEEDISILIPVEGESKNLQKVLKSVNFTDKIIVTLQKNEDVAVEELTDYASEFIDSLQTHSSQYIKNIRGRVNDDDLLSTMNFV